jgi:serine protease Do
VLTVWSYVLDTDYLAVTLNDGRKFEGKLVGANPALELAVLKIDSQGPLPFFDLSHSPVADVGSRVLAFSNLFGVAMGEEAASVQHGVVAAKTRLDARRGAFETPYHGAVYVIDAITNNPGAAGGALTNLRGELLGMLGKELRNSLNHTWLNYALPVDQLSASVDQIIAGKPRPGQTPLAKRDSDKHDPDRADGASEDRALAAGAARLAALGIVLVPDVLERTPPFVDEVRPGSPAAESVRPDDLVVFVGERLVQSCKGLLEELAGAEPDTDLKLVVMRGQELIEVSLKPGPEQAAEGAP